MNETAIMDEIEKMVDISSEIIEDNDDSKDDKDDKDIKDETTGTKDDLVDDSDDTKDTDVDDSKKVEDDKVVEDDPGSEKEIETPKVEDEKGDKEKDEVVVVDDKALIESLRKQLEESHSGAAPALPAADDSVADPAVAVDDTKIDDSTKEVVIPDPIDFIGSDSLDSLLDTKEGLNKLLNIVYSAGMKANEQNIASSKTEFLQASLEENAKKLPELVTNFVNRQSTVNDMVRDFYGANEDLVTFKSTVAAAANQVHAENSDWTIDQVFNEAAVRTRTSLGLSPKAANTNKERKPAFVDSKSSRSDTSDAKLSGVLKEIDDLINL